MRPIRAAGIAALLLLASCATNPLRIPPPPHALPSRPRVKVVEEGAVAESRPAAIPEGFAAAVPDGAWHEGDMVALELEFEDGEVLESFWLVVEVVKGPKPDDLAPRATVRVTLLEHDGTEIGTSQRRIDPARIVERTRGIHAAYSKIVGAALTGDAPENIQQVIEDEMSEGSEFDESLKGWFRDMRRMVAPRFLRRRLETPALNSSLGGISVLDVALAALLPPEALIDVQRLGEEQAKAAEFDDIPVERPLRLPFVFTLGGAIQLRFAITFTSPAPPYVLAGGILELAGVNEARGDRRFLIRVVSAKRGEGPESRPAESQPTNDDDDDR